MRVAIVTPVFNDWVSLSQLIRELEKAELRPDLAFSLFAIDDGSSEPAIIDVPAQGLRSIREIQIITLACNLGHQRAIAVGLVEVSTRDEFDAILIMDSDGEDSPAEIANMVSQAAQHPGHIICAQRQRRPGQIVFQLWYECYKFVFRLLTGSRIDFGNFCFVPRERLDALISNSSIWNNLAGTLTRSRLPLTRVPSDRGKRYAGTSKMNFVSLVTHGLSAMAVYIDVIMVRILLSMLLLSAATGCAILGVLVVKYFTALAVPGWATTAVGILGIILLQALMLATISSFIVLSTRNMHVVVPRVDADSFTLTRQRIFPFRIAGIAE